MSYSDDTAAFMFAEYQTHTHDYRFWKVDDGGWLFACDCGSTKTFTDNEMRRLGVLMLDIVGPAEIADMMRVHAVTVDRWRREGVLPPPEAALRRGPVWRRETIVQWAVDTGREVENHATG